MPDIGSLSRLEVVRYGNVLGVDWEGTSINDVKARIRDEGLNAEQVREKLRQDEEDEEEARRDHNDVPLPPVDDDDDGLDHYDPAEQRERDMQRDEPNYGFREDR